MLPVLALGPLVLSSCAAPVTHNAAIGPSLSPFTRRYHRAVTSLDKWAVKLPKRNSLPRVPSAAATTLLGTLLMLSPAAAHGTDLTSRASSIASSSFIQAWSLVFVSELGDKTFFIAALLAARASKLLTFAGAAGALALMSVVSVFLGQVFHNIPSSLTGGLPFEKCVAVASFVYFGMKGLVDASRIESDGQGIVDERQEAEKTLREAGGVRKGGWPLVVEAFTLSLMAEIGDRSQMATIALGAAGHPLSVAGGATLGHWCATGLAVLLGGSVITRYLSEWAVQTFGGILFLVFAATTASGMF